MRNLLIVIGFLQVSYYVGKIFCEGTGLVTPPSDKKDGE